MEVWMVELSALCLVLICVANGAYQGLLLKVYSLVKVILLLAGTALLTFFILVALPKSFSGREVTALVAALIITAIVLGVVARALKIVDHIPVVNQLNKLGGAVLGAAIGIVLLWGLMVVFVFCSEISWCEQINRMIMQSTVLRELYLMNPFMKIVLTFLH